MKSLKESKINLWEEGQPPQLVSIKELEDSLHFHYLPQLSFKDPMEEMHLLEEGLKQAKMGEVLPEHSSNGQKWKREIEEGFIPKVSVRWIGPEVGYGLFLEEDLAEGVFVGEYIGEVRKNNDHLVVSNYLYTYPLLDDIGRNFVIDAHQGCLTRFINHSYTPQLRATYAYVDGLYHMILVTLHPISKGTQLTFNYGKNYWYYRSPPKVL